MAYGKIFPCVCVCAYMNVYMSVSGTAALAAEKLLDLLFLATADKLPLPVQPIVEPGVVFLQGFQFLKMGLSLKRQTRMCIAHFESCLRGSAHRETPGRGMTLFIFHVSPVCPCGKQKLPYHERADKDTARPRHRFPQVPGLTLHRPYQSLRVQLQELLLASDLVSCRFNLLLCCCLCCKALYHSFKSAHAFSFTSIPPSQLGSLDLSSTS